MCKFSLHMKQVNNEECAIDMIMNKSSRNDACQQEVEHVSCGNFTLDMKHLDNEQMINCQWHIIPKTTNRETKWEWGQGNPWLKDIHESAREETLTFPNEFSLWELKVLECPKSLEQWFKLVLSLNFQKGLEE